MGFFDELFGKKPAVTAYMYLLECAFHPFKLSARQHDAVDLEIRLKNTSGEVLLTSVVVVVPKELGFEKIGLQQEHESRLGLLNASTQA